MNDDRKYKLEQLSGADVRVKSLLDRTAQTPTTKVVWSGERGQSKCYPMDNRMLGLLQKYGQECVRYDRTGEPDFKPFEEVHVKIPDMTNDRSNNFNSAYERLLKTEWAKEKGISTVEECKEYLKKHRLTLHECSDGVTIRVVDRRINAFFGHSGGVGEIGAMGGGYNREDSLARNAGKLIGESKINLNKKCVEIQESIDVSAVKDNSFICGGISALEKSSVNLIVLAVNDAIKVSEGKKSKEQAAQEIGGTTAKVFIVGGIEQSLINSSNDVLKMLGDTNAVSKMISVAAVLKDSFIDVMNGTLEPDEFVLEASGKCISMLAGTIAGLAGGPVASFIVQSACTMICNEIQRLYFDYKKIGEEQSCYLSELNRIYYEAQEMMDIQRKYLNQLFIAEEYVWNNTVKEGFKKILEGGGNDDFEQITSGLDMVLSVIGKETHMKSVSDVRDFMSNTKRTITL